MKPAELLVDAPVKPVEAAKPADKKPDDDARPAPKPADKKPEAKPADKKAVAKKAEAKPEPKPPAVDTTRLPKAPPWWRTLRADPPPHIRIALGIGLIALIFAVWWFVTRGGGEMQVQFNGRTKLLEIKFYPVVDRIVSFVKLPSPAEVFGSFGSLWDDRELTKHLVATLERVFIGVVLAAVVGVSVGVLAAAHRGVNAAIAPIVIFLRSVPMGPLLPLTLMLFGGGEPQKSRFIFLALVAFVFSDTVKAISIVPERYVETAQTLGASRFQIIRKVLVPLALPDIITSLRFLFGLGLGYITLAEVFDTEFGIGKLINVSERLGNSPHVWLILFVIALVALGIDLVLRTIQRGVFAWRKDL